MKPGIWIGAVWFPLKRKPSRWDLFWVWLCNGWKYEERMVTEERKQELSRSARDFVLANSCTKAHSGTVGKCVYCERDALRAALIYYRDHYSGNEPSVSVFDRMVDELVGTK